MKKVLKLLIITVLTLATVAGLIACDGANGKAGEKMSFCANKISYLTRFILFFSPRAWYNGITNHRRVKT